MKKFFSIVFSLVVFNTYAQHNFSYLPIAPKAGETITITYEPAGVLQGNLKFVNAVYYSIGGENNIAEDIELKREGKKFIGTVKTDTANSLIYFGFHIENGYDNNFNNGYYILLTDDEGKIKNDAYTNLASFYQYGGRDVGVDKNPEKALDALQKQFELFPHSRRKSLPTYAQLIYSTKKEEAPALIQKETEGILKGGMTTEEDYEILKSIYMLTKLPEHAKLIETLQKEKFPQGKWLINDIMKNFFAEKDPAKAQALSKEIIKNISSHPDWKNYKNNVGFYELRPYFLYISGKDWKGLAKALAESKLPMSGDLADLYNEAAWEMQQTSTELPLAESFAFKAASFTKNELKNPTAKKPTYLTGKQWEDNRKYSYAQYGDTYGMVLYRMGQYKKGFEIMQEVMKLGNRKNIGHNNTYALLAEKALSPKKYQKEIEDFLRAGKASGEMMEGLKRAYIKEKRSENGYETYIAALKNESYLKMLAEVKKSMINETAPSFTLLDLEGKKVNLSDLKGKTVVADFWATWCGPCISSFPGMQKMVNKYKDDPGVKFVFIDTWENGDDKNKKASEFMTTNNYSFHVLMDEESKVVEQFKVEGIPTKFIIDKHGKIRFKSVGYEGNEDALMQKLTAMLDLVMNDDKKQL